MVGVLPWFSKNNKLHGSGLLNLLLTVQLVLHGLWSGLPSKFFFFFGDGAGQDGFGCFV